MFSIFSDDDRSCFISVLGLLTSCTSRFSLEEPAIAISLWFEIGERLIEQSRILNDEMPDQDV